MSRFTGNELAKLIDVAAEYEITFTVAYSRVSDHLKISIHSADPAEQFEMTSVTSVDLFIKLFREHVRRNMSDRMH